MCRYWMVMWELRLLTERIALPCLFMTWENTIFTEESYAFIHLYPTLIPT